ncbi:MAG: peptide-methionine (S)-S-oxide reductase MsrA [Lewinellaceae bacterium]|nr:peptide-methionine (S)-S-oxide reductase MsrA [Lewinellaceae bacterium]
MKKIILLFTVGLFAWSCANSQKADIPARDKNIEYAKGVSNISKIEKQLDDGLSRAVFAGGCFWCVEEVFERVKGVEEAVSGYAGPDAPKPTYELVCTGTTDYAESVAVYYDPEKVSYEELLTAFFAGHDPTQLNRQGPDVGPQYRSAVFYQNEEEKQLAQAYIDKLNASGKYDKPIATTLEPLGVFYVAEGYHQDYYPGHLSQPYVARVSVPKVEKFTKAHPELLKEGYQSDK